MVVAALLSYIRIAHDCFFISRSNLANIKGPDSDSAMP